MKKILLLAALFAVSMTVLVGCSKDEKDDGEPKCWEIVTKTKIPGFFSTSESDYFWGTQSEASAEVKRKKNELSMPGRSYSKKKAKDKDEYNCYGWNW